jgi:4-amino-4-deoxy-L-arabinose transferase-like glycosyltransferase
VKPSALYLGLAGLVILVWLGFLGTRPLFNPDEGRYAEIPREMLAQGDWVIPHLNGLAYIEKPPLQYWGTALSYAVFGVSDFSARLYTALCALGTVLAVAYLAKRLWSVDAAWRTAAVLAGMLLFLILGQLLTLDMGLTFWMSCSLVGFIIGQICVTQGHRWMLLAWVAAAMAVLSKGLVAAAIPACVLVLYSLAARDFAPWRRLQLLRGLPLFLAITVPWHWLAARRLDDFLQFFFVHEHFARYLTTVSDRVEPWWYFGAVFLAGTVPWTVSAVRVVATGWRAARSPGEFNAKLFLWIWVVFIGVFFSMSDSKLIPYILPLLPALAVLIAAQPEPVLKRDLYWTAVLTLAVGVGLGWASLNWTALIGTSARSAVFLPLVAPVREVALLLLVTGAFVSIRARGDTTRMGMFLGVGWCLGGLLLMRSAGAVAPIYSGVDLAAAFPSDQRNAPLYSVATYDQSLIFYLQREATLVRYRGELDYGLNRVPDREIKQLDEFIDVWSAQSQAFAVMENGMYDELKVRGVAMRVLGRNFGKVLVART